MILLSKVQNLKISTYIITCYGIIMAMEKILRKSDEPFFEGVDCVSMCVSNLEEGLRFYRDILGMPLLWRTEKACGLGMKEVKTEFVLTTDDNLMVDMKVENVEEAVTEFVRAGGVVEDGPFDIDIGKCAVVADPWGNRYCILDTSKGTYDTDDEGVVSGVSKK